MRRVVVTGLGIVSSIGNNADEVLTSLREARSGIVSAPDFVRMGFRSQVYGAPTLDPETLLDRRAMRFHALGTAWCHVAMDQAIARGAVRPAGGQLALHRADDVAALTDVAERVFELVGKLPAPGPEIVGKLEALQCLQAPGT